MKNKINIAELLKDCPKSMELDCTMFDNVVLDEVNDSLYPISILAGGRKRSRFNLTKTGCCNNNPDAKCVIFPKGKTTWEGFQRPFKDGDIVTWKDRGSLIAFIYKERKNVAVVKYHFALYVGGLGTFTDGEISLVESELVFATEEEKQQLFDAIKANGYTWNPETKTLEKIGCQYPKTYEECCDIFNCTVESLSLETIKNFRHLIYCRNAYWAIAGEQMGLGKPWEPDWINAIYTCTIICRSNKVIKDGGFDADNRILAFPTAEMRDAFYENFKDLINETKELL